MREAFRKALVVMLALLLGAAAAGGLAVLRWSPELRWYGGLSGVAHAVVVYAALRALTRRDAPPLARAASATALAAVAAKLLVDAAVVRHLAATYGGAPVVVAGVAHRAAAAFAVALFAAALVSALPIRPRALARAAFAAQHGSPGRAVRPRGRSVGNERRRRAEHRSCAPSSSTSHSRLATDSSRFH